MQRIDDATSTATLPALPTLPGSPAYFNGTPGGGTATIIRGWWLNLVQESLMALVEGANQAGAASNSALVYAGVKRLASSYVTEVTSTVALAPANIGLVLVDASAGDIALTLPAANGISGTVRGVAQNNPVKFRIVRLDASGHAVTIVPAGSDELQPGAQTAYAMSVGEAMEIESDGVSGWYQITSNMLGRRTAALSGSGTWTPGAWVVRVRDRTVGGGGGGGGGPGGAAGGGGGGGGYAEGEQACVPGTGISYAVGAGGIPGSGSSSGGNGGTSTFGAHSATGGTGGQGVGSGAGNSGPGGVGSGATVNAGGTNGNAGLAQSSVYFGGSGGASQLGGGGAASGGLPSAGTAYGGGGGGGANGHDGAAGAAGAIFLAY